jgi:hypothetical protein
MRNRQRFDIKKIQEMTMIKLSILIKILNSKRRVSFDDAQEGPQIGFLLGTFRDISNGCAAAVVEVGHAIPSILWHVPAIKLIHMAPSGQTKL